MSKGKERASYYDDEEEGGIEEGQEEGSPTPEAATDAEPVVKHPTYQETWYPKHVKERPRPPSKEEQEARIALLEAQARAGQNSNDPRARARGRPRRTVDCFGPLSRWKLLRTLSTNPGSMPTIRPQSNYVIDLMPPAAYPSNASTSYCTKYIHTSIHKVRTPVNCVRWTPDGRRVLTGSTSGEFTMWNGLTFNYETVLLAHDHPIRCFEWSSSGAWLVSCDQGGVVKYFAPNLNNVTLFNGHAESIRDVSFSPDDQKFVTGSDDGTVKVWDFERRELDKSLTGHGYDVKCVKWHPTKSLLVSGSKNNLIKFWDPRTGSDLHTLHDHKNSVQGLSWNANGNMVASAARDQSVKVFDIRMMRVVQDFRGHLKDVCSVQWHPIHHSYLVSGGSDGSLQHWHLDSPSPVDSLQFAHDQQVWTMAFHPLGHLLATGAMDASVRWWCRGRPGSSIMNDKFHVGRDKARELGQREDEEGDDDDDWRGGLPGLGRGGGNANNPNLYYSSAAAHMPNFAMPGLGNGNEGGAPSQSVGGVIPGLDGSSRTSASAGIPGLAPSLAPQGSAPNWNRPDMQNGFDGGQQSQMGGGRFTPQPSYPNYNGGTGPGAGRGGGPSGRFNNAPPRFQPY